MSRNYALGIVALLLGVVSCLWGIGATSDLFTYGTNEWTPLLVMSVYTVCLPGALVVFVLARFVGVRGLRRTCFALAMLSVVLPFVMSGVIRIRSELARREGERMLQQQIQRARERGLPAPTR